MNQKKNVTISDASSGSLNENQIQSLAKRNKSFKAVSKLTLLKKPKFVSKSEKEHRTERIKPPSKLHGLQETKIYYLPLMPTDDDEKNAFIGKEFRCSFCSELCDVENLECKVCARVFHIICLFNRGYLDSLKVPLKLKWTCADCSDLSKILTDEEMRKIINIFDELDIRKEGFVQFEDFMSIKKKIFLDKGYIDIDERLAEEERIFKLIDSDDTGFITWNEFCEFEAASLLTKKNKIELSNHLTMNELIHAKKKFLSYVQDDSEMITKKDARDCYIKYVRQLEKKLGSAFMEHMRNCAELLSLNTKESDRKTIAKTIWPEFIRKITILILFDRINTNDFKQKYHRPKIFDIVMNEKIAKIKRLEEENKLSQINMLNNKNSIKLSFNINEILDKNSSIVRLNNDDNNQLLTSKSKLPPIENTLKNSTTSMGPNVTHKLEIIEHDENELDKLTKNNYFSVDEIMSENMQLDNFKPHLANEFGSFHYMIRSRHLLQNRSSLSSDEESQNENQIENSSSLTNINNDKKFLRHNQLKPLISHSFNIRKKKKNHNLYNSNSFEMITNYNKSNTNQSFKLNKLNHTFDNEASITNSHYAFSSTYLNNSNLVNNNKPKQFEYNKITNDIYKIFGRTKQAISYPQQISDLNKIGKIQNNNNGISTNSIDKILNLKDALSIFSDDLESARNMLNYKSKNLNEQSQITDISKYVTRKENDMIQNNEINPFKQNTKKNYEKQNTKYKNKSKNNMVTVKISDIMVTKNNNHLKSITTTPT